MIHVKKNIFVSDLVTKEEMKYYKKKFSGGDGDNIDKRLQTFRDIKSLLQKHGLKKNSCLFERPERTFMNIFKKERPYIAYKVGTVLKLYNMKDINENLGKGAYGIVYRADIIDLNYITRHRDNHPIAAKVMDNTDDNKREVKLSVAISNKILKNKISKHFLLCYKSFHCKNSDASFVQITKNEELIHTNDYLVSLNEIADGDVYGLFRIIEGNRQIIHTIIVQAILSIMTFHKLGWIHQDCHLGNFLYKKIIHDGFYHYKILDEDYYVPNYGYDIMLNDYGRSEAYTENALTAPKMFSYWNQFPFEQEIKKIEKLKRMAIKKFSDDNYILLDDDFEKDKIKLERLLTEYDEGINELKIKKEETKEWTFKYDYNDYMIFVWNMKNKMKMFEKRPIHKYRYFKREDSNIQVTHYFEEEVQLLQSLYQMLEYDKYTSENDLIQDLLNEMVGKNLMTREKSDNMKILNEQPFIIDDSLRGNVQHNELTISTPLDSPTPTLTLTSNKSMLSKFSSLWK